MNELKPEDVMSEGAVIEALELRAPHDAVCRYALALLREKDKEIEVLGAELSRYTENVAEMVETARAEAVSEFAERLYPLYRPLCVYEKVWRYEVDQIAKEMKGEGNVTST